jgi:fructokinase
MSPVVRFACEYCQQTFMSTSMSGIRIGIDFGGTKIEAAALDATGRFLTRLRASTPRSYDASIQAIVDLVAAIETELRARTTVGVGTPGSVSPTTGVMRNANAVWLNGRAFREDLSRALGREVRIANDANCFALSEAIDGAAADSKVAFGAILGTGCGGGVVIDGRLLTGANGIAGEWGHIPLPGAGREELTDARCWCGQAGCAELFVSGSGLSRDYARASGTMLGAAAIVDAVHAGDDQARAAFDRYVQRLARTFATICDLLDPDTIVLGGGMSNVGELYERLPGAVRACVFSDHWHAKIVPARWGDSSGVRGAAWLWPKQ